MVKDGPKYITQVKELNAIVGVEPGLYIIFHLLKGLFVFTTNPSHAQCGQHPFGY